MTAESHHRLTNQQQATFTADGVVKVEGAVEPLWVDRLLENVDDALRSPGEWHLDSNPDAPTDRLFTARYRWRHDPAVHDFVFQSGIAGLVGEALGASSVRFYFDHLLLKEPGTPAPTPWHHDIPYWPFMGQQIGSAWVALTEATVHDSSLEFVRGSHQWGRYFSPELFNESATWMNDFEGEPTPDIETARADYDIVGFDVEPGDAIIFSAWSLHSAPGNSGDQRRVAFSTRWLGDDAVWAPEPGADPTVTAEDVAINVGDYPADDDHFPVGWTRGA